jgi:hypothetical protein
MNVLTGYIKINVVPIFGSTIIVTYKYNENFVYRELTFYLNIYTFSGLNFDTNVGSIFNHENTYQVVGGIQIDKELPLHAHICDKLISIPITNKNNEIIEQPIEKSHIIFYFYDEFTNIITEEFDFSQLSNEKIDSTHLIIDNNNINMFLNEIEITNIIILTDTSIPNPISLLDPNLGRNLTSKNDYILSGMFIDDYYITANGLSLNDLHLLWL